MKDWLIPTDCVRLLDAVQKLRKKVQWKPGKDAVHLKKRQGMQHPPSSAILVDYEKIVYTVIRDEENALYLYDFRVVDIPPDISIPLTLDLRP